MNLSTIKDLEKWLAENCIKNTFTPGNRYETDEGFGIENYNGIFIWYHAERGQKENIKYSRTEKEIVDYAFEIIKNDKYLNSHLVGSLNDALLYENLLNELKKRNIDYWSQEISQGAGKSLFRVYVYRCDIKKVTDLKEKYFILKI